jgi:hypothetical protein
MKGYPAAEINLAWIRFEREPRQSVCVTRAAAACR